ncbi:MAG: DMT family transporter [Proteobacteria bacterium]|nr:DMT family transporter [Pseudomonadota bacterium]
MRTKHMALLLLVTLIGGTNFLAVKFTVTEIPPVFASALRFLISGVILIPFLKIQPGRMRQLIFTALNIGVLNFALVYIGFARAGDVSTVAIVSQAAVPFSMILAVVLLKEKVGFWRITATITSLAGIVLLGFDPRVFEYIDAVLLILAGVAAFSFGTIQMRRLGNVPPLVFMAWLSLLASTTQFLLSFFMESGQIALTLGASRQALGALVYTGVISTVFAHAAFYYVLQRNPVSRVMPFTVLAPLFGVILSILVLGEVMSARVVAGGLLTFAGVMVITFRNRQEINKLGQSARADGNGTG